MRIPETLDASSSELENPKPFEQEPPEQSHSMQKSVKHQPFHGVKVDLPPELQLAQACLSLESSAQIWEQIDKSDPEAVANWARKAMNKSTAFDPSQPLMPLVSIYTGANISDFPPCLKDIYTYQQGTLALILWNLGLSWNGTVDELRTTVYVASISSQYSFPETTPRHLQAIPETCPY
ncbi:hypothetical protein FGRMN_7451 [Fusarium graminum]|nr:hypothetical protein FGRMN_7451 [Fusarium graminum]